MWQNSANKNIDLAAGQKRSSHEWELFGPLWGGSKKLLIKIILKLIRIINLFIPGVNDGG